LLFCLSLSLRFPFIVVLDGIFRISTASLYYFLVVYVILSKNSSFYIPLLSGNAAAKVRPFSFLPNFYTLFFVFL